MVPAVAPAQEEERPCSAIAEQRVMHAREPGRPEAVVVTETSLPPPRIGHFLGSIAVGRGLRFNNPYRLATPLGRTPESLSLTATYVDLALGATVGRVGAPWHGVVTHLSVAAQGVSQQTITPSYLQLWRAAPRWLLLGRLGVPVVTRPDVNAGLEGAVGALWRVTGGTGVTAEVVGSLFYGAATRERDPTAIPLVSLQLGVFLDYEVIP